MEKYEILNVIYNAVIEVSPCATELLANNKNKNHDIFFVDLGVNSIDYAEIINIVMDKLHMEHPLDIFTCTNRINDLVDIFYDLIAFKA